MVMLKLHLSSLLEQDAPFLLGALAVILSGWYGGFGPGMLATVLSSLIIYLFFIPPKFSMFNTNDLDSLILVVAFIAEGFIFSIILESRRKLDAQKSEFISIVSHELKNPLATVKGYSELISKRSNQVNDKNLELYAKRIILRINQMNLMINELLDISKIESGRLTYIDEEFSIAGLVKEIVKDQNLVTEKHRIILKGFSKKSIKADRYRIGQVITNLISNAVKYSPQANKVVVELRNTTRSVLISVRDFGIGIDKSELSKIFNPYFRARTGTKGIKGTGIGLFISNQIAKRHKGKIWVKSSLNRGSVFYLELPTV